MNTTLALLKLLDSLLVVADVGSTIYLKLIESRARVEAIRGEGRDPTDEEWEDLFSRIDANHEAIQNS